MVLLPGAGGRSTTRGRVDGPDTVVADDFRVIVVEHRGHGRTNNPTGSMTFENIATDVAELVDQRGLGSAHIAGISDGGVVALDCALRRSEMTRPVTTVGANYCVHDGIRDFAAIGQR